MKVIRNGEIRDIQFSPRTDSLGTLDGLIELKTDIEILLANKAYLMKESEHCVHSGDSDSPFNTIWEVSHNGATLKVRPCLGSCSTIRANRLLDSNTRWKFNQLWSYANSDGYSCNSELYPVEGDDQYTRDAKSGALWMNPKRWKYIEDFGKYVDELLAKF